jgi:hypothetical protein
MTTTAEAARVVAEIRDDPAGRIRFASATYRFSAQERRYQPYEQSVVAFMRWQQARGVLNPPDSAEAGSPWWRAINEDLLRDTYEARLLLKQRGDPSRATVAQWVQFFETPSANTWYLAHNASVVAGYLRHRRLAEAEAEAERFLMNVTLLRVLYAHALVADGKFALGRLSFLAKLLETPMLSVPEAFLAMKDVLPHQYPIDSSTVERFVESESWLGKLIDHAVIGGRLDALYAFSAQVLAEPRLLSLLTDGTPAYAWPQAQRQAWNSQVGPVLTSVVGFFLGPRPTTHIARRPRGAMHQNMPVADTQARPVHRMHWSKLASPLTAGRASTR